MTAVSVLVPVRMVHVRRMRVRMTQAAMLVQMRVWLARRVRGAMRVLVMLVMHVRVGVN